MSISSHVAGKFTKKSGGGKKTLTAPTTGLLDYKYTQSVSSGGGQGRSSGSSGGSIGKYMQKKTGGGQGGDSADGIGEYRKYLAVLGDMALKRGFNLIFDKDGKAKFVNDKGENMKDNKSVMSDMAVSAGRVGLSEMLKAYANDGQISDKEWKNIGGKVAIDAGKNAIGNYTFSDGTKLGNTTWGNAGLSAGAAGAGTALSTYLQDGEIDWEKTGWSAGKSGLLAGMKKGGASAGAMGTAALALEMGEHKLTADDMRLSDAFGAYFGAVAGPIGGALGAMAGEAIQGGPDTFHLGVFKDESKPPIWVDKNGKVQVNDMVGVMKGYSNIDEVDGIVYHQFEDPTEARQVYEAQRKMQLELAQDWQDKINNYDNLSLTDQYMVDQFIETGEIPTFGYGSSITGKGKDGKYTTTNAKAGEFGWEKTDYNVADMGEMQTLGQINKAKQADYLSYSSNPETSIEDEKRRDEKLQQEQKGMYDYYMKLAKGGTQLSQQQQEFIDNFTQPEEKTKGLLYSLEDDGGVGAYSQQDQYQPLAPTKQTTDGIGSHIAQQTNPVQQGYTGTATVQDNPYANYDMEGI